MSWIDVVKEILLSGFVFTTGFVVGWIVLMNDIIDSVNKKKSIAKDDNGNKVYAITIGDKNCEQVKINKLISKPIFRGSEN